MPSKTKKKTRGSSTKSPADKSSENLLWKTESSSIIDSLLGSSNTSDTASRRKSDGKRKSLLNVTDSQETYAEDESDEETRKEEEEKEELWNELNNEKNILAQKEVEKGKQKPNDYLFTLEKKFKNPQELDTHYSQCIDLFSKNKVNAKNAFKLQLIDCMKLIMDKKTEKSENLTLMSCTLDASAKIYSCRVDNVYTNMVKFVKTYQTGGKKKDGGKESDDDSGKESKDEGSNIEDNDSPKKKQKDKIKSSKNLKSFIKEPDSLNRKEIEMRYYRQNMPRKQTYFLESSILDDGCQLVLNRRLFVKYTPQITSYFPLESVWSKDVKTDDLSDKIPGYGELRSKIFLADDGPEEEVEQNIENSFTFDPTLESIAEIRNFNDVCDGQSLADGGDLGDPSEVELDYDDCEPDPMSDDDVNPIELSEHPSNRVSAPGSDLHTSNLSTPRVSFTPVAMSRILRSTHSKHSDYSYFDDSKLAFMPSAAHWKIKPSKRSISAVGKTPAKVKQNSKGYLDFLNTEQMKLDLNSILEDSKQTHKLSTKTTRDWFYNKDNLIFKPIIPNVKKNLLSFHKHPEICIFKDYRNTESSNEEGNIDDSILLNPQGFASNDSFDDDDDDRGDDHPGDYHPQEDWSEKMDQAETNDNESKETSNSENPDNISSLEVQNFDENALVPAPTKVEKVSIAFARAQKRIDIKKLKLAIWNLMDLENKNTENKENENNRDSSRTVKKKEVDYSEIYTQLPNSISKEAAAELSYPIAFMAILHMANEKCLRLTPNQDHSNFTVSLESDH